MNYGYNTDMKDWDESRKWILAEELEKSLGFEIETRNRNYKNDGESPYIEVDGNYEGVRIRRITNLSEKQLEEMYEKADHIYGLVMNNLIRE